MSQAHVIVKVKSLSRVRLFATLWTVARHAPRAVGFSRQEYWSGLPCLFVCLPSVNGLNCVSCLSIHSWSLKPHYLSMWLYQETEPLKRWFGKNEAIKMGSHRIWLVSLWTEMWAGGKHACRGCSRGPRMWRRGGRDHLPPKREAWCITSPYGPQETLSLTLCCQPPELGENWLFGV